MLATKERHTIAKRKCKARMRAIPEFKVFERMHHRCKRGPSYLALGILVSTEWHSFKTFFTDMGQRPSKKHEIDRIDTYKGYSKNNCRWILHRQNCWNTTKNNLIEYKGITKCLMEWCIELGFESRYHTYKRRLYRGWSTVETFETPIGAVVALRSSICQKVQVV